MDECELATSINILISNAIYCEFRFAAIAVCNSRLFKQRLEYDCSSVSLTLCGVIRAIGVTAFQAVVEL